MSSQRQGGGQGGFSQSVIDAIPGNLCILDRDGTIVAVNRAWRQFQAANGNGEHFHACSLGANYLLVCEAAAARQNDTAMQMASGIRAVAEGQRDEFALDYPGQWSNEQCWFTARVTRFHDQSGHVMVVHETISKEKMTDRQLGLAARVFAKVHEGVILADQDGTILDVNDGYSRITGFSRQEAIGRTAPMLDPGGHLEPDLYEDLRRGLSRDGHWYGEAWNRHKNGAVYIETIAINEVRDPDGTLQNYIALIADISVERERSRRVEQVARFDALTALPNRALLTDRLNMALAHSERRGKSLAVVYLDFDDFKMINDRHGHSVGDEALIAVAARLRTALREGDTLARIGGDEFVALLSDLDSPADADIVLNRLLRAASEKIIVKGQIIALSASLGVAFAPDHGVEADLLLRHADQAMLAAKQAGKNCYHRFDLADEAAAAARRASIEDIRTALERREFVLHYQPKVNMRTGEVIGVEALIRWQHPARGLLSPANFLPSIEGHPLSVQMGHWVLESALAQMTDWHANGHVIPVSVNIAAPQLQRPDFLDRLQALLAAYPVVRPDWLELEILETSALEDMTLVSKHLHACRELGIGCALDDFGTGYSSLGYLRRLPANMIKIDQSFVRGMLEDGDDLLIIQGMVGLAKSFERRVIAEGVETVQQGERLLSLGCDLAQGFVIARPMPGRDVPAWVKHWRPDPAWGE